jgi:CheY-like chemotaxis protein
MPNLFIRPMPIRALVIDDHVDIANTVCELLQLLGCKTAAAFGGITGARLAELFRPDIVFMDFGMPDLDGEAALTRIRQAGRVDALFVCMTGQDDPQLRERSLQAGFHHFLTKPVEPEVFERLIEQVRQGRRGSQGRSSCLPPAGSAEEPSVNPRDAS